MLLPHLISTCATPGKLALTGPVSVSYAELLERTLQIGGALGTRHPRGTRMALVMHKSVDTLCMLLGAWAAGMVVLPLDPNAPAAARNRLVSLADIPSSRCWDLVSGGPAPTASPVDVAPSDADDVAMIGFTSGTTGTPKGALISHGALAANLEALHEAWQWQPEDTLLHALPMFHIHGLVVAQLGALWAGASTHWMHRFDSTEALGHLRSGRISVFMGVPTFHHRLLAEPGDPEQLPLRLVTSGSAPLPAITHDRFHARFGRSIVERYGMTEIGIVLSNPIDGPQKPGTVGVPLPGVRCRVTDPETGEELPAGTIGEVRIKSPTLMLGYDKRPDATERAIGDGWMRTGDLGSIGQDGYVRLAGRRDDMILSGGYNIYPLEVGSILAEHPAVSEIVVVGLPHRDLGKVPAAMYVGDISAPQLSAWAGCQLPRHKLPRSWAQVRTLPRNPTGKIDRRAIVLQLSET